MKGKHGFVYIWRDKKHNRYYIGSHWGTVDDGYICSSDWMKKAYARRPHDFKRRIIEHVEAGRGDLLKVEHKWLSRIKESELGKRYYNLNNHLNGHWTTDEEKRLTIREKLSKAQKQNFEDPEYKARFMETRKRLPPQTAETREKRRLSMLGKNVGRPKTEKFYESCKRKKGVPIHSPEHKQLLKETSAFKMLNKTKVFCKFCGAEGNVGNIARYHNDHCKQVSVT